MMLIEDCEVISFSQHVDARGTLTFLQQGKEIPFEVKRVYYIHGVPVGIERGAHGHKKLEQVLIALTGSLEVQLDDGFSKKIVLLNTPSVGLHVQPGMWRVLRNFSSDAVLLVLASELYDESDYFRHYEDFLAYRLGKK